MHGKGDGLVSAHNLTRFATHVNINFMGKFGRADVGRQITVRFSLSGWVKLYLMPSYNFDNLRLNNLRLGLFMEFK